MKLRIITFMIALAVLLSSAASCDNKETSARTVKPMMTALEPPVVTSGQTAQIVGKGFPSSIIEDLAVFVGGTEAEILSCEPTAITIKVPDKKDGVDPVIVHLNGSVLQGLSFTYINTSSDASRNTLVRLQNCPAIKAITADTVITVASGVYDTEVTVNMSTGLQVMFYVLTVDQEAAGAKFKVALANNAIPTLTEVSGVMKGWTKATLTSMASTLDGKDGNVVAMVNGDFWNTTTIIPKGPVHFRGNVVSKSWDNSEDKPQQGVTYVGVGADGHMSIGTRANYVADAAAWPELTGGGLTLVQDGNFVSNSTYTVVYPRCGVGYTSDNKVYFLVVDGRSTISGGMDYANMSDIFVTLGCDRAVNLDGGGSAQLLIRNPWTQKFEIRNKPADGAERPVINCWAVVL